LSFPLYAAGAWYFGAPKYPKRFVNPAMGLLHSPTHIKKTAALRFVFNISLNFKLAFKNTKPLRLGLAVLLVLSCNCFFDFSGPWD